MLIACLVGMGYLFYQIHSVQKELLHVCLIKNVTGFPCPSCGTTRAVVLLLEGKIVDSTRANPFGILVAIIMTVVPFWILIDIVLKKETFYFYYKKTEVTIRKPWLAIFLISFVLLLWIWNIYKHL